eukprot:3593389-Karenia_brevis.AAC.1
MEYLVDEHDKAQWKWARSRPWCGQTVFVLDERGSGHDRKSQPQGDRKSQPEEYYIGEGPDAEGGEQGQGGSATLSVHDPTRAEDPDPTESELMFTIEEPKRIWKDTCPVCEKRKSIVECQCCPRPIAVCGSCCLLRHVEQ